MIKLEPKHYALLGAFIATIGAEITGLKHGWSDALTPAFIGTAITQFGLMIGAMYVGAPGAAAQLAQAQGDTQAVMAGQVKSATQVKTIPAILLVAMMGGLSIVSAVAFPACAPPVSIQTEAGKAAFKADLFVQRLGEISAIVRADTGTQPGQIRPADAFFLIASISGDAHGNPPTIGVAQVVASGGSPRVAARTWWNGVGGVKVRTVLTRYPKLAIYVDVLDALIGGL